VQGSHQCKVFADGIDGLGRRSGLFDSVARLDRDSLISLFPQFFLELWAEINHRASLRATAEGNASLPDLEISETAVPEDTIFEELVTQYGKLIKRSEDMIVQQVCGEIESGLRPHLAAMMAFVYTFSSPQELDR
jgi:RINT-1 / TIP-1 family